MTEWFQEWFGEEYLRLYPHRNDADAERLVRLILATVAPAVPRTVLDVCCGAGRHARAFEAAGCRPIGLDLSRPLLRRARSATGAPLVQGDIRRLPFRPRTADLTVNLFTSFGYFSSDDDHRLALRQMVETVRPGGWFVLDFFNAEWVRAGLVPREETCLDGASVSIEREISADDRFVTKTITVPGGRRFIERVRLFRPDELAAMIEDAGAPIQRRFGTYDGGPLGARDPRVILFARAA
jgi:SAM-dependent methyltransferase